MSGKTFTMFVDSSNQSNKTDFTIPIPSGMQLDGNYYIGCSYLSTHNSRHNITSAMGNNKFIYTDSVDTFTITIPDGVYGIEELDTYLKAKIIENSGNGGFITDAITGELIVCISLVPNYSTGKVDIIMREFSNTDTLLIHFSDPEMAGMAEFLGFSTMDLDCFAGLTTFFSSDLVPNVNNGITSYQLHCDLVSRSFVGGLEDDILIVFNMNSPTYALVKVEPINILYLPISRSKVDKIRFRLTDNLRRDVNLNGEAINMNIIFKLMS